MPVCALQLLLGHWGWASIEIDRTTQPSRFPAIISSIDSTNIGRSMHRFRQQADTGRGAEAASPSNHKPSLRQRQDSPAAGAVWYSFLPIPAGQAGISIHRRSIHGPAANPRRVPRPSECAGRPSPVRIRIRSPSPIIRPHTHTYIHVRPTARRRQQLGRLDRRKRAAARNHAG